MSNSKLNIDWKFKKAMKEKGLTLQILEGATGINRALLSMYGNGRYNLDGIERQKIARALRMPEKEIFSN